jgi:hypothetical protein
VLEQTHFDLLFNRYKFSERFLEVFGGTDDFGLELPRSNDSSSSLLKALFGLRNKDLFGSIFFLLNKS